MFNLKTVFAATLISALSFTTTADDLAALELDDLQATINAELIQSMENMQKEATATTNDVIASDTKQEIETTQVSLAE